MWICCDSPESVQTVLSLLNLQSYLWFYDFLVNFLLTLLSLSSLLFFNLVISYVIHQTHTHIGMKPTDKESEEPHGRRRGGEKTCFIVSLPSLSPFSCYVNVCIHFHSPLSYSLEADGERDSSTNQTSLTVSGFGSIITLTHLCVLVIRSDQRIINSCSLKVFLNHFQGKTDKNLIILCECINFPPNSLSSLRRSSCFLASSLFH